MIYIIYTFCDYVDLQLLIFIIILIEHANNRSKYYDHENAYPTM